MLYVLSAGEIMLIVFILFLYIAITNMINRHYYTKRIRKIEKAIKELNNYGSTDINID